MLSRVRPPVVLTRPFIRTFDQPNQTTMTKINSGDSVTSNGDYLLSSTRPTRTVEASGDFGGGSVVLGVVGRAGDFCPVLQNDGSNVEFSGPGILSISAPTRQVAVKLSGATSPTLTVYF